MPAAKHIHSSAHAFSKMPPPMLPKLKLIHPLHLETTCCPCCRGFERLRCACPVLLTRRERPSLKLACWWRIRYSSGPLLLQIHIELQRLFAVPGCNARRYLSPFPARLSFPEGPGACRSSVACLENSKSGGKARRPTDRTMGGTHGNHGSTPRTGAQGPKGASSTQGFGVPLAFLMLVFSIGNTGFWAIVFKGPRHFQDC